MPGRKATKVQVTIPDMLAILINESFADIRGRIQEEITLREFLKMAELYYKLSPKESVGKEFWDMMNQIRRDAFGKKKTADSSAGKQTTSTKKRKAHT